MTVPVQIVHGNFSQKAFAGGHLRDGSVVAARVISQNGNGSYTVSLAGQMIEVRSEANLTAGEVFSAKVKIAGNQISLSLVQDSKKCGGVDSKILAAKSATFSAGSAISVISWLCAES